ncbi:metal-dependent transcriptional regulator [Actinomyces vulturis]|uniref:metal-dependent transcriptional regulator n=1 Tax=Actinomyces vulturis TaxID=1857645 RepID=UPI000835F4DC|nr:metal-dependent transcriptional regulator [Actinomyces vulturis]
MSSLIDTTEMYLKTVYELEEDGVPPLRARIVERLGHSGPTVSQTVSRIERDGLLRVKDDRELELTDEGWELATEVVRKHRLAERFLLDVVGLDIRLVHDEACRWEHVMGAAVEERLEDLLATASQDPFGNPIPVASSSRPSVTVDEISVASLTPDRGVTAGKLTRIGEPVQAAARYLDELCEAGIMPGEEIAMERIHHTVDLIKGDKMVTIPDELAKHLFVENASLSKTTR